MEQKLRFEGIYDQRTLKHLKLAGVKDFSFDFSPTSFNFVQEYVFLENLLTILDPNDKIFLHFKRSNDPMIEKIALDIQKNGRNLNNIFFEIDEWSKELSPQDFSYNYLINYTKELDNKILKNAHFKGFIFNFNFLETLYNQKILTKFAINFHTRFQAILAEDNLMVLQINWDSNLISTLFEIFDFNVLSYPINSNLEVCYRNVDLKKLSKELEMFKKNTARIFNF